ncbi:hypothetical protein PACILC2_55180 [Paenibacillus cisolokensis]|uniref:Periplasmic binding protein/LacI sugar binding domain-containing protein n=1 Tax=Paenibacillus cisolokensis TaxID=1658519 RepID=A0ABQ4NFX3_9BACL|nr:hypothetical protein PACILC2_55180 [Paenibacillus cisolokensis]
MLDIIHEYNYRPNALASGLITKKTGTIGLLVPDITNAFFSEVVLGVEEYAGNSGFNVILCNTNDNQEKETEYLSVLRENGLTGSFLYPPSFRIMTESSTWPITGCH